MRRLVMLLATIVATATFTLVGCGGGDGGPGNATPFDAVLVGTWQPYMATVDGTQAAPAQALSWDPGVVRMTIGFADDGTATVRHYDGQGLVATQNGTWTAQNGNGTLTIDGDDTAITYALDGQVMTITFTEDGSQMTTRCVPVVTVNGQAADLARAWRITAVEVNGAAQTIANFFEFSPEANAAVLQMTPDGTFHIYVIDEGGAVIEHLQGAWATDGELLVVDPPDKPLMRGVWATGNTSVTFLDGGDTTKFELAAWATPGVRDATVAGQWMPQSVTVNGAPADMAAFFEWEQETDYMLLDLLQDGTALVRELSAADQVLYAGLGTWNTGNSQLTLDMDVTVVMDYTVTGNTLTVGFVDGGDDVAMVWSRVAG